MGLYSNIVAGGGGGGKIRIFPGILGRIRNLGIIAIFGSYFKVLSIYLFYHFFFRRGVLLIVNSDLKKR